MIKNWRKSSYSEDTGTCVELGFDDDHEGIRDSTDPDGPSLRLRPGAHARLIQAIRNNQM